MRRGAAAMVLVLVAALPLAAADHDGVQVVLSTDFDEAHPPVVGVPADLNYYVVMDGVVHGHRNSVLGVLSGGVPLLDIPSTHEHDGIVNAFLAPAEPGPFVVHAELPPEEGGDASGEPEAWAHSRVAAVPLVPQAEASLALLDPVMAPLGLSTLTFQLTDAEGRPLDGYVLATVFVDDAASMAFAQAKLVARQGQAAFAFMGAPHPVLVRAVAWPSLYTGPMWQPVTLEQLVEPSPLDPAALHVMPQPPPLPDPMMADAAHDHTAGAHLYLSTDPAPRNFITQRTRVNVMAMDEALQPVRHVDMSVKVTDTLGQVWMATENLHEVDGIGQVDLWFPRPGDYRIEATATPMAGEPMQASTWVSVMPLATNVLPTDASLDVPEALTVGQPEELGLGLRYVNGDTVPHTDHWLRVLRDGMLVLDTKIHTHEDIAKPTFAAASAGEHEVRLEAYPQSGGILGNHLQVKTVQADGALAPQAPLQTASDPGPARNAPGFEVATMTVAVIALILVMRRVDP